MNNKVLSLVLVLGIASTGFAGISAASSGTSLGNSKTQQSNVKGEMGEKSGKRGFDGFGKRAGYEKLSQEEKTQLSTMSETEKQAFFEAKKVAMQAERAQHKTIVDALIAGQTLTASQEAIRLDMLAKMQDDTHPRRDGGDVIEKLLAGDVLTDAEQTQLDTMQKIRTERELEKAKIDAMSETERQAFFEAKKSEMKAKMELIKPLMKKQKSGASLSEEEQAQLDAFKAEHPMKKGGKMGKMGKDGKGHKADKMGKQRAE